MRGAWKVEKVESAATLVIEPFEALTQQNRAALTDEAERLVRFLEPEAKSYAVTFGD